jgi:putative pyruvate formate lyase activating enzyme
LETKNKNRLHRLAQKTMKMLKACAICPRKCGVNRLRDEKGFCKTGLKAKVYSFMAHHGEEPPISADRGSGTIFFSYCNMACSYCQNYEFSQLGNGREADPEELAGFMLNLQKMGCHNINFVTPTHVMPQLLKALCIAVEKGLNIPLVYNTAGYELAGILKLLEGVIDIYLPDMRYGDKKTAAKYSRAPDYPRYNQEAIKEMQRQVGIAKINTSGIMERGLIIRHLVLPQSISATEKVMRFIAKKISDETYISLMSQYMPYYNARQFPELSRRLNEEEYQEAKRIMEKYGLSNGWIQESYGLERFAGVNIKPALLKDEPDKEIY